jgi:REP element-mobilizing transposase RayT
MSPARDINDCLSVLRSAACQFSSETLTWRGEGDHVQHFFAKIELL